MGGVAEWEGNGLLSRSRAVARVGSIPTASAHRVRPAPYGPHRRPFTGLTTVHRQPQRIGGTGSPRTL